MKNINRYLLAFVLVSALCISGCSRKENTFSSPEPTEPTTTEEPAPTATPEPTPVPYERIAEEAAPSWHYAGDEAEIQDAIKGIRENAETSSFSGEEFPTVPVCAHLSGTERNGDQIVSDGQYLYILSEKDLIILRADGTTEELISHTQVGIDWTGGDTASSDEISGYEKTPFSLYPAGTRLAVLYDWYGFESANGDIRYTDYTGLDVYDLTDPSAPVLTASFGQDGSFKKAMIRDGLLYAVTEVSCYESTEGNPDGVRLPRLYANGETAPLAADKVCLTDGGASDRFVLIGLYDIFASVRLDAQALLGPAAEAFSAGDRLCFISSRWVEGFSRPVKTGDEIRSEYAVTACTDVFCVEGSGKLSLDSSFTIHGFLPDVQALDYTDGMLRAAVSLRQRRYTASGSAPEPVYGPWEFGTAVYLLDEGFQLLGRVDASPGGENTAWIGFLTDKIILTTESGRSFPVDIHDPSDAQAGAELSVPIADASVLPWGDDGYMAFYRTEANRLTLSVRDEDLRELAVRTFGSDHSNTLDNTDCYLSDGKANILAFAADDSYCVYGYDKIEGIFHRLDVFLQDWAWNARGFVVGDRLYVATSKEFFAYDLADMTEATSFEF